MREKKRALGDNNEGCRVCVCVYIYVCVRACVCVCVFVTGSDSLEEIGILTLQHPSVPRKSRIQCLVSHTFSGFCCWNVPISHTHTYTHAHTHTEEPKWIQKITDYKWLTQRELTYHFHIHTLWSMERRVWICYLPWAKGFQFSPES